MNKIRNKDKYIHSKMHKKYFGYENPPFLAKYLLKANRAKNNEIKNQTIYSMNELRKTIIKNEIPESKNSDKIISIFEKSLNLFLKSLILNLRVFYSPKHTWVLNRITKQEISQFKLYDNLVNEN